MGRQPKAAGSIHRGAVEPETLLQYGLKAVYFIIDNPTPKPIQLLVPIQPWLLLSDEDAIRDLTILRRLGVTHVLTINSMPE